MQRHVRQRPDLSAEHALWDRAWRSAGREQQRGLRVPRATPRPRRAVRAAPRLRSLQEWERIYGLGHVEEALQGPGTAAAAAAAASRLKGEYVFTRDNPFMGDAQALEKGKDLFRSARATALPSSLFPCPLSCLPKAVQPCPHSLLVESAARATRLGRSLTAIFAGRCC